MTRPSAFDEKSDGPRAKRMKVAIVSQYYRPESTKIVSGLATELAERGHSVRVVTGYPNYPEGKLYSGYKQRVRHYESDGKIAVRRVPIFISHSSNAVARMANYLSFALSSLTAWNYIKKADVVYVYATQMTAAFGPRLLRLLKGVPYVLHVQDLWPESITESSMIRKGLLSRFIIWVMSGWLRRTYKDSSGIIAIAPTMAATLIDRGADASTMRTVFNWADEEHLAPPGAIDPSARGDEFTGLTVTYAGNIGELQDLGTVLDAIAMLKDLSDLRLVIVGQGIAEPRLKDKARALNLQAVDFRGRVSPDEMIAIYAESDFQLVPLRNLQIFNGTIPSKFQGSMAGGVPVIATVPGDLNRIVREHGVGFSAAPEDAESLAMAIRHAYQLSAADREAMAERSRRFYWEYMSLSNGADAIVDVLAQAATSKRKSAR